jgi:hypothetical protein
VLSNAGYRFYLETRYGASKPRGYPAAAWHNSVLKTHDEWNQAVAQVKRLGLPVHRDQPKNWDTLAALDYILKHTSQQAKILDAGAELYSTLLPSLFLYGYENLRGINLVFDSPIKNGSIVYQYGDITHTEFEDNAFDAITCLSTIEHGIDLPSYFQEMSRVLVPGGTLITSTDYYDSAIDTGERQAFGVPIRVFTKHEIEAALALARRYHLELTGAIDLRCDEKAVSWKEFGLDYTFVIFMLRKRQA